MDFLQKIDQLMIESGLNKHTLAQKSGIPYTTIVGLFERGKENARVSTINKLCSFFNVSMDYLLLDEYRTPEEFTPNGKTAEFCCEHSDEIEIVRLYRSLNSAGKNTLLNTARAIAGNPEMQEGHSKQKESS